MERINPRKREMHVAAISRIENEFHIGIVEDHRLSGSELSSLYDALDAIFNYYGIDRRQDFLHGVKIVIMKEEKGAGDKIKGAYLSEENEIRLFPKGLGSLVHEFIHAIDFNFRSRGGEERTSCINTDMKAFLRFLKASGVSTYNISDFCKTFSEMVEMADGNAYLARPSEILARMGAYSFWKDNRRICEMNPFLKFSPKSYKTNPHSKFGRSLCAFPFHRIDAVRYFIHHASREEAGLEFAPWHPERQKQKVPDHDYAWYAEKRSKAEDIIDRYRKAAEDLDNAEYNIDNIEYYHTDKDIMDMRNALKKAEKEFAPVRGEYQRCISFFMDNIRDAEFHYRLAEIRSDCVPTILAAYLGDCENVLSLAKEEEQEKKHARRMEKDAL